MKVIKRIASLAIVLTTTLQIGCAPSPEPRLQIGKAYAIDGIYYQPQVKPDYREVGYASWYGPRFHAKRTANGEIFDKFDYTAAHKTLPLPSIVKVTNLENGRSMKVRVNDRGPFVKGRIIDLSMNAAKQLGFYNKGKARVIVELDREASLALLNEPNLRMNPATKKLIMAAYKGNMLPSEISQENHLDKKFTDKISVEEKIDLNNKTDNQIAKIDESKPKSIQYKQLAANQIEKKPGESAEIKEAEKLFLIQVASTTSSQDVNRIKSRLKNLTSQIDEAVVNGKKYYRVRIGGIENMQLANQHLQKVKSAGFKDAFIIKANN
jgi:rare lipoprotein A